MVGRMGWSFDLAVVILMFERLMAVSCLESFSFYSLAESFFSIAGDGSGSFSVYLDCLGFYVF
jgi:hypothetical protein